MSPDALAAELAELRARVAELEQSEAAETVRLHDQLLATTAELAELRAAVTQVAMLLDQKPSLFHQSLSNRLRALASQPQGERGRAILAVVEAARKLPTDPDSTGHFLTGEEMAAVPYYDYRAVMDALAAIDGAQP